MKLNHNQGQGHLWPSPTLWSFSTRQPWRWNRLWGLPNDKWAAELARFVSVSYIFKLWCLKHVGKNRSDLEMRPVIVEKKQKKQAGTTWKCCIFQNLPNFSISFYYLEKIVLTDPKCSEKNGCIWQFKHTVLLLWIIKLPDANVT